MTDKLGALRSDPAGAEEFEAAFLDWRRRAYRPAAQVFIEQSEREADGLLKSFFEQRFFSKHLLRAVSRGKTQVGNAYLSAQPSERLIFGGTLEYEQATVGSFQVMFERLGGGSFRVHCPMHQIIPTKNGEEVLAQFLLGLALTAPQIGAVECRVLAHGSSRHLLSQMGFDFIDEQLREGTANQLKALMEHFNLGQPPPLHSASELGRLEISGRLPSAYRLWAVTLLRRLGYEVDDRQIRVEGRQFGRMLFLSRGPWWGLLSGEELRGVDRPSQVGNQSASVSSQPTPVDLQAHLKSLETRVRALTNTVLSPLVPLMQKASPETPLASMVLAEAIEEGEPYQRRLERLQASFRRLPKGVPESALAATRKVLARWGILRHHRSEFLQRVALTL